jgi:hypothetical protein
MSKIFNILKGSLLMMIFAVLFLPMIQSNFNFDKNEPLKGDVTIPENSDFTKEEWLTANYQHEKEEYLNSMFGFRNTLVRLNNQIDFNLFNKANAKDVVIGKENYLYELNYIKAYTGQDFIGKDSITHTLDRLKFISDTLQKLNKQLIVIFAPGKASFYPEYIPDEYLKTKNITNYSLFVQGAIQRKLNTIDFNKWFIDNKHKSKYPLYPQHGVHWSTYGATLAADSLIKTISTLRNINMPHLTFNSVRMEQAHGNDYDIADGMNLLFKFKSFDLAYPNLNEVDTVKKIKPKVLVISDSFYWGMYELGIAKCFDANHHVWYYNKQVFPETFTNEVLVKDLNLKDEIAKYDVIVISATDNNLRDISWKFIENAEKLFKGLSKVSTKDVAYYSKLKEIIANIKTDTKWVADTKMRAKEKNISYDSCLVLEAMWQLNNTK